MKEFGIQIKDESKTIPSFAVEHNEKSVKLFDWQRRAVSYFFEHDNCAIFEVTTGAGKSFAAIEVMKKVLEKEPDINVLIVVPKNVILEKTWYNELYDAGFTLKDVGFYYGAIKECSKITITNMQCLDKIALDIFDMIILDEVHNYATKRMMNILKYPFKYKLGLSATLERADSEHYQIMKLFDFNVFEYTPQEALKDGILNPFNFTNVSIEMDSEDYDVYLKLTEEFNFILQMGGGYFKIMNTPGELKNKMLAKMNERKQLVLNYYKKFEAVASVCQEHSEDKILVFNEYNEQTNKVYWQLLDCNYKVKIVHSGIPNDIRERNMTDFKNDKYNILCTSKVLDEGYNLPKIDTAIIMAGNSTAKQTIQRMGRVLRKKKKISNLYQIYIKGTMEEDYANERARLFKELCNEYKQFDLS